MDLPPSFQVGKSNGDGDCFFDSFAQGLKQLKPGLDITVKSLRLVCKGFAQSQLESYNQLWLKKALKENNQKINQYIFCIEITTYDIQQQESQVIRFSRLPIPIWGRSEIEGRIICAKYNVKLHVVKKLIVEEKKIWTHHIVDSMGSRSVDAIDYNNDENTLHVVNTGDLHFEPILRMKTVQQIKQRLSGPSDDHDEEDIKMTAEEELFYAIKGNDSETEKVTKIRKVFEMAPRVEINFQGINNDTCLHIAVRKKELKVIKFLVKRGARTDIKNDKSRSPLDVARRLKREDILEILQPDVQQIFVEEQKKHNQERSDGRSKKSERENGISRLNDDDLPSKKYLNSPCSTQMTEGKYNNLTYEKRSGATGMHGQLYEINLIMMLLLQAEAKKKVRKINSFYLATNMQGAGAFDDVVFKYKHTEDGVEKSNIIFLQAKHKEADKEKKFTIDALLSQTRKGDFQLRKYFTSYIRINQHKFKENHPLFLDGVDRSDFVIYTNSAWSFEKNKHCVKKINLKPEDALNFFKNTRNCYYQLNANETVKSALRDSLDFEILVRELAQSVYSGNIELSKDIFKDYHVSLANRVLQISKADTEKSQFRRDFLDGTQDAAFSRAILEEIRNNKHFFTTFSAKSDNELKEELREKIIKLPKNFGCAQDNDLNLPLPNKTIPDETIEEFLEKLKIFTDQPNVNDLEIAIKKMIINVFRIEEKDANLVYCEVYSKITKWWRKQKIVKYLTEHNKLFNNAKEKLLTLHLVGLAILYAKRFKSLGLSFKSDHIEGLSNLIRKKKRILHIISDQDAVLLSTVKVYQAIEGMTKYNSEDDNYKYIFLSLTSALQLQHKVISTFKSKKRDLLVIECQGTETNFEEFYIQLKNIVKLNEPKKILLITRENDRFSEQFKRDFSGDGQYEQKIDKNNTLADLDIGSQAFIEKKQVIFQGVKMELGTLVDEKSKHLVASDVLSKVINGDTINVDKTPCDLDEVKYYYIKRVFHRRMNIKKECFKETHNQDIFVVSNVKDNEFSLLGKGEAVHKFKDIYLDRPNPVRLIILDDDQNIQETLKQLYSKYQTSNIHWVKKQGDKFIWRQSNGSLSNLRKFLDTEDITEYPTDKISNTGNKVVIVSAEPGMGKSVLLTKLVGKEKKSDPSTWVARINLSDFTKQLNEMHFDENKLMTRTINFLSDILDLKTPLERQLFKHRVENLGKVILFFDGFDEISPHYKEKVIALVKILKETKINKLWITTRPHMRAELEDNLSVLSYSLKPLSTDDQKHFLKKFWSRKLHLKDDNDDKRLNTYIEGLLKAWSQSIGDKERDFTGIPLQIKMLAEIYYDELQDFYNSDQSIPSFPGKLNFLDLYQSFIDKKYDIYWLEKNKVDKTIPSIYKVFGEYRSKFMLNHQLLALDVILSEQDRNLILKEKEKDDLTNYKRDAINGLERTGIINLNSNNTLNFIHRTFAEYFTAFWLADNIGRRGVKNLLNSNLFETDNTVLRSFFDRILASGENNRHKNDLHNAVLTNDIIKVKELCSGSPNSDVDKGGRTALHLAAAYGLSEVTKVLLENNSEAINMEDTIFGWRPLSYADKGHHWHLAELLLQNGAIGDDMPNAISNISSVNEYALTLLHITAKEGLLKLTELLIWRKAKINARTSLRHTPLHYAAINGHLNVVKFLAEKGADVHCQNRKGDTVLHYAARNGHLEIVKFLAEKGANVQCQNHMGHNVLHYAALYGHLDVVKFLAEKGADVQCQNREGNTVLHYAAKNRNLDVVKFLAKKGADVQCQNHKGDTALHYAARNGHLDVVKFLTETGADAQCQNREGDTVVHYAAINGNLDVVKFLTEKGIDVECQNNIGDTVMHYAAKNGNLNVVKFLAEKGADVQCQNREGDTGLHNAARFKNWDVVKFLTEKGADVQCQDRNGDTVLHYAARNGHLDVVEYLTEKGADVQCQDREGDTALHYAARNKNWEVVEFLVEKGADVQCQNREGDTVLHYAANTGYLDVVEFLAEKGADVQCQNRKGDTVMHYAARNKNWDVVKFLVEKGADVQCQDRDGDTALHYAARNKNWDIVKFLTEKGTDVKCENHEGDTVLHYAAKNGNLNVVKFLTEKGADVQCQNYKGYNVLHYAALYGHFDVVNFFAETGADIQCQNREGDTILHYAAINGNLDVVKFLTEKGADVQCQNNIGDTVMHYAAKNGNLNVVKFLAEKGADVLCQNRKADTVMHYAARNGHLDVVKFLAETGADVQCQDREGDAALHYAARNKNWNVVKLLIENGADIQCQDHEGDTVLHYAVKNGNLDVVQFLAEKGAGVQCQNHMGQKILHYAALYGHLGVVKFLAEKGADVQCENHEGDTILHYAASSGNLDVVKFLTEKGIDVECQNNIGDTVLHYAAKNGNLNVVKFLVGKGADVQCQNHKGHNVLHYAARFKNWDVVKFLAEKGADVQCQDRKGDTVLHYAARNGHLDVVEYLTEKGADVQCQDREGDTALHYAARNKNWEVVKFLAEKGADAQCQNHKGDNVLHYAAKNGNLDVVKLLVEKGADVQCQSDMGQNVLHYAARYGHFDVVKFLAEKGADVQCQNREGDTVLHYAARNGNLDVVKFLTEKGADIQCQNNIGDTVMHYAAKNGNLNVVKFLTEKEADVQCQNREGDTALHYAARNKNWDVVRFLAEKGAYVQSQNREGDAALHYAVRNKNRDAVKFLAEKGADVQCENHEGDTALHYAAKNRNLDIVKLLAGKEADVDCQNNGGNIEVHDDNKARCWGIAKLLLEEVAYSNCRSKAVYNCERG